jgi:hypothetical protein
VAQEPEHRATVAATDRSEPGLSGEPLTDTRLQVFLSYSRKDLATAERLRDALIPRGFGAYLDKHDILPGEPWKERLAHLIETADTVVFLLSPDSVASAVCDWEVNEAERLGKRILPVVIRDASADAVPRRLQRLNYIFLRDEAEAADGLVRLEAALLTDIAWVREHSDAVAVMVAEVVAFGSGLRVGVGMADRVMAEVADDLEEVLRHHDAVDEVVRYRIGPSVGSHVGPRTVGCFMLPRAPAPSTRAAN